MVILFPKKSKKQKNIHNFLRIIFEKSIDIWYRLAYNAESTFPLVRGNCKFSERKKERPFEIFGRQTKIAPGLPLHGHRVCGVFGQVTRKRLSKHSADASCPISAGVQAFCQKRAVMRVHKTKSKHKFIL
ncbi:MAG: hypothetical protein ACI4K9_00645 [Candidatus Fimenecus sp.]